MCTFIAPLLLPKGRVCWNYFCMRSLRIYLVTSGLFTSQLYYWSPQTSTLSRMLLINQLLALAPIWIILSKWQFLNYCIWSASSWHRWLSMHFRCRCWWIFLFVSYIIYYGLLAFLLLNIVDSCTSYCYNNFLFMRYLFVSS